MPEFLNQPWLTFVVTPLHKSSLDCFQNAMTSDNVYILSTCIHKNVTHSSERLYLCFVDYARLLNRVHQEALLCKL